MNHLLSKNSQGSHLWRWSKCPEPPNWALASLLLCFWWADETRLLSGPSTGTSFLAPDHTTQSTASAQPHGHRIHSPPSTFWSKGGTGHQTWGVTTWTLFIACSLLLVIAWKHLDGLQQLQTMLWASWKLEMTTERSGGSKLDPPRTETTTALSKLRGAPAISTTSDFSALLHTDSSRKTVTTPLWNWMPRAEISETEVSGSPAQPRQSTHFLFPTSQLLNFTGWSSRDFCLLFNYLYSAILPSSSHFVQRSILDGRAQCRLGDSARKQELPGSRSLENPGTSFALSTC